MGVATGIHESVPAPAAWLQAQGCAAAWVDAEGIVREVNDAYAVWLGQPPRELVGQTRAQLFATLLSTRLADDGALRALAAGATEVDLHEALSQRAWTYTSRSLGEGQGCLERVTEGAQGDWLRSELTRAMAEKDDFLARFSHELRTPMTAMMGFCHMLLDYSGPLTIDQLGYVQKILKNASILLQMLNNVLDLSKLNEGRMTVCPETVEPAVMLNDVISAVEPQTFEKALPLRVEVDPDLPDLVTDRLKLKQILINLLSNAVKYTDRGEIAVEARLANGEMVVTVADTGIGIPAEQLEAVFEPYVQATVPGRPARVASTGLGLTISRALADLLGGRLSVSSALGQGSRFTLCLPLALPTPARQEEAAPPA